MKTYELLAIFKPNLDADEVDKAIAKISSNVDEFGGKFKRQLRLNDNVIRTMFLEVSKKASV